jgi:predicted small lipoprotein YifL
MDKIILTILCLALSACGQTGPLYLPDEIEADEQPKSIAP